VAAPPEGVAVCDIAVPLRPHRSSAIDKMARAKLATKSDENLTAMSSENAETANSIHERRISRFDASHTFGFSHA
jgi:hypothetical protein